LSKDSVSRHAGKHLPRELTQAKQIADISRAESLAGLLDEALQAARSISQGHLRSRELTRIVGLLVTARRAAAEEQRPQQVAGDCCTEAVRQEFQTWIDRMPPGLREALRVEVGRQREERHRRQVVEAERAMAAMVLPLDDGTEREAARTDEAVFHHDGIRAQCSCGRWLRFVNARPLVEDVCEDCQSS
jgi:hypothetical protein